MKNYSKPNKKLLEINQTPEVKIAERTNPIAG